MIRLDQVENYTGIVVMNPRLVEEIQADEEALAAEAITAHKMIVLPARTAVIEPDPQPVEEAPPAPPVLSPIAAELQRLWQDGFAAGMADPMIKLVKAEVDQNDIIDEATAYARKSAGELIQGVNNTRPIQSLISRSIDEEWTDARLQKALSRIVGLDTRSQVALDNLEKKLTKDGLPVGKRNKQVDAYSKTLKARRVKVIADNERASAFAEGKRAAWRRMKSMDEISPYAVRIWRTQKDEKTCPVCGPLNGRRAGIDDNRGYRTGSAGKPSGFTLGPPAHVNCRCWEELVDRGTAKVL
ncbi:Phage head morphogenesis domain containing protein [uncultured Caudovirales phage]|uniref:Phage head morphogenesis domain containing protein n=1 Tax=uncultured Caudovirales phage TaxID=2100421 RepID=A0A6J5RLH9_9CAUD|nr:Phage head morphogenesis domain containing protein [uncultured Caudovirales phage]